MCVLGTEGFRATQTVGVYALRECYRRAGLRLLRMLGDGVKAWEAAEDARAASLGLRGELRQLLDQLWRQVRHGQLGRGEVMVARQLPAALHTLGGARESQQEARYQRANAGHCTEKQSESKMRTDGRTQTRPGNRG